MTPSSILQFTHLVELFEEGLIGELEFKDVALDSGAPMAAVEEVLESIRAEDGVES